MIDFKNQKYIMGILNITPDSFYDGGRYNSIDAALQRVEKMLLEGADIIDIGAESSRPGSKRISLEEEINRLIPILKEIKRRYHSLIVSIDTYKPEVAKIALDEGADIINDIYGLRKEGMIDIIKKYNSYCIIMHMKGDPETMQLSPYYDDVVKDVADFFEERIKEAESNGISKDKIIIDPGIGFGKRVQDNIELIKNIPKLKERFKLPLLVGVSRKSFIGHILNNNVEERKNGSVIVNTIALLNGADIIRVHDIKESVEIKKIILYFNQS